MSDENEDTRTTGQLVEELGSNLSQLGRTELLLMTEISRVIANNNGNIPSTTIDIVNMVMNNSPTINEMDKGWGVTIDAYRTSDQLNLTIKQSPKAEGFN